MQSNTQVAADPARTIRVMLVDDSPIIRGMNARFLDKSENVRIVASVSNGELAVQKLEPGAVDVIVLDIEMPIMDGLTAIPLLLQKDRSVKILMSSTLTQRGAEVSFKALELGAADFIPKPSNVGTADGRDALDSYRREIVEKVLCLGASKLRLRDRSRHLAASGPVTKPTPELTLARPEVWAVPRILAVGSSTGGPQALLQVFRDIKGVLDFPVLITQHMPPHFTEILAKHINDVSEMVCREAVDGELLEPGRIYVAPGDFHMIVKADGLKNRISLNQDPPENYCRPAVDPMFRSVAECFGKNALCVVLTGMGRDGAKGAKIVADHGGNVIAQDEKTSVVWGMPGAAYGIGACSKVLPIAEIGPFINNATKRPNDGTR